MDHPHRVRLPLIAGVLIVSLCRFTTSAGTVTNDFSTDPNWTSSGATVNNHSYGYHPKGAVGGTFARAAVASYYADTTVKGLSLDHALTFQGNIVIAANRNFDGHVRLGYFDKHDQVDFLGIEILEPRGAGDDFRVCLLARNAAGSQQTTDSLDPHWRLTLGQSYHFTFTYTPLPNGNGEVTLTITGLGGGYSASLSVKLLGDEFRSAGSTFNAFGLATPAKDVDELRLTEIYVDDLSYHTAP